MNKNRLIKFTSVFLLVSFISFSSLQIRKTYTKAIAPAILLGYGVELLFNIAATAFVSNAVYNMGTEARKIYDDWQNNKNDDEKKAQYAHWGNELKSSMTDEEVNNALNSAGNVVDGAVNLGINAISYQNFIDKVNKDKDSNISVNFDGKGYLLPGSGQVVSLAQKMLDGYIESGLNVLVARHQYSDGFAFVVYASDSKFNFFPSPYFENLCSVDVGSNTTQYFSLIYDSNGSCITSSSSFEVKKGVVSPYITGGDNNPICVYCTVPRGYTSTFDGFEKIFPLSVSEKKEISVEQPAIELKPNSDYDSEISVKVPTTEISPEQLTQSPYEENSESFSYPDGFENAVNNTEINNELNKNPIKDSDGNVNDRLLDYGDTVNLDFSPLYGAVEDKFPFCIPFDLFHAIDTLTAEKEKPEFTITFPSVAGSKPTSFIFNFDDYELVIEIFRYFVLLAFCIGLVVNTKKILGGS